MPAAWPSRTTSSGLRSPPRRKKRHRYRSAALRAHSLGGSAAFSDQLANAWPGPGVRAAFVSGGARPFVASCLRVVISLDLAAGTRAGVNATAPRPGLVLGLVWSAKER